MTVAEALGVLRERGPDRAAESELLGEWLLARAGMQEEAAAVTVAPGGARDQVVLRDGRVTGEAHRVPWARDAARIAMLLDGRVLVVERVDIVIEQHVNLAGDARDTLVFDGAGARTGYGVDPEELFVRGALTRIELMAGALDRVYAIAVAMRAIAVSSDARSAPSRLCSSTS